jgi:hypothetical protein
MRKDAQPDAQISSYALRRSIWTPSDLPFPRADDGIRTRDPHLGKVMLYQLSHVRSGPPG